MKLGLLFSVASLLVSIVASQEAAATTLEGGTEQGETEPPAAAAAAAASGGAVDNSAGDANSNNGLGTNSANQQNQYTDRFEDGLTNSKCHDELIPFDPFVHKPVYVVGVHAIRGFQQGRLENEDLFEEVSTVTNLRPNGTCPPRDCF
jgi:hypothetical protein